MLNSRVSPNRFYVTRNVLLIMLNGYGYVPEVNVLCMFVYKDDAFKRPKCPDLKLGNRVLGLRLGILEV